MSVVVLPSKTPMVLRVAGTVVMVVCVTVSVVTWFVLGAAQSAFLMFVGLAAVIVMRVTGWHLSFGVRNDKQPAHRTGMR